MTWTQLRTKSTPRMVAFTSSIIILLRSRTWPVMNRVRQSTKNKNGCYHLLLSWSCYTLFLTGWKGSRLITREATQKLFWNTFHEGFDKKLQLFINTVLYYKSRNNGPADCVVQVITIVLLGFLLLLLLLLLFGNHVALLLHVLQSHNAP